MISDVYDLKEVDGVAYEADCAMITIKKGADVDIGANASAEEAGEELEDGVETVNNVVYSFRLNQTSFDKKSYLTYLKGMSGHLAIETKLTISLRLHEGRQGRFGCGWKVQRGGHCFREGCSGFRQEGHRQLQGLRVLHRRVHEP